MGSGRNVAHEHRTRRRGVSMMDAGVDAGRRARWHGLSPRRSPVVIGSTKRTQATGVWRPPAVAGILLSRRRRPPRSHERITRVPFDDVKVPDRPAHRRLRGRAGIRGNACLPGPAGREASSRLSDRGRVALHVRRLLQRQRAHVRRQGGRLRRFRDLPEAEEHRALGIGGRRVRCLSVVRAGSRGDPRGEAGAHRGRTQGCHRAGGLRLRRWHPLHSPHARGVPRGRCGQVRHAGELPRELRVRALPRCAQAQAGRLLRVLLLRHGAVPAPSRSAAEASAAAADRSRASGAKRVHGRGGRDRRGDRAKRVRAQTQRSARSCADRSRRAGDATGLSEVLLLCRGDFGRRYSRTPSGLRCQ